MYSSPPSHTLSRLVGVLALISLFNHWEILSEKKWTQLYIVNLLISI